jgi:hypothetical protein
MFSPHRLEGDGYLPQFWWMLWQRAKGAPCGARVPIRDTVVFHNRVPIAWFFTSKEYGGVLKKSPSKCSEEGIERAFLRASGAKYGRPGTPGTSEPIVAVMTTPAKDSSGHDIAKAQYLDTDSLSRLLHVPAERPSSFMLQRFVPPSSPRGQPAKTHVELIRAIWTPAMVRAETLQFEPVTASSAAPSSRPSTAEVLTPCTLRSALMTQRIEAMCLAVAGHARSAFGEEVTINRLVVDIQRGANDALVFTGCICIRQMRPRKPPVSDRDATVESLALMRESPAAMSSQMRSSMGPLRIPTAVAPAPEPAMHNPMKQRGLAVTEKRASTSPKVLEGLDWLRLSGRVRDMSGPDPTSLAICPSCGGRCPCGTFQPVVAGVVIDHYDALLKTMRLRPKLPRRNDHERFRGKRFKVAEKDLAKSHGRHIGGWATGAALPPLTGLEADDASTSESDQSDKMQDGPVGPVHDNPIMLDPKERCVHPYWPSGVSAARQALASRLIQGASQGVGTHFALQADRLIREAPKFGTDAFWHQRFASAKQEQPASSVGLPQWIGGSPQRSGASRAGEESRSALQPWTEAVKTTRGAGWTTLVRWSIRPKMLVEGATFPVGPSATGKLVVRCVPPALAMSWPGISAEEYAAAKCSPLVTSLLRQREYAYWRRKAEYGRLEDEDNLALTRWSTAGVLRAKLLAQDAEESGKVASSPLPLPQVKQWKGPTPVVDIRSLPVAVCERCWLVYGRLGDEQIRGEDIGDGLERAMRAVLYGGSDGSDPQMVVDQMAREVNKLSQTRTLTPAATLPHAPPTVFDGNDDDDDDDGPDDDSHVTKKRVKHLPPEPAVSDRRLLAHMQEEEQEEKAAVGLGYGQSFRVQNRQLPDGVLSEFGLISHRDASSATLSESRAALAPSAGQTPSEVALWVKGSIQEREGARTQKLRTKVGQAEPSIPITEEPIGLLAQFRSQVRSERMLPPTTKSEARALPLPKARSISNVSLLQAKQEARKSFRMAKGEPEVVSPMRLPTPTLEGTRPTSSADYAAVIKAQALALAPSMRDAMVSPPRDVVLPAKKQQFDLRTGPALEHEETTLRERQMEGIEAMVAVRRAKLQQETQARRPASREVAKIPDETYQRLQYQGLHRLRSKLNSSPSSRAVSSNPVSS